jgi:putative oxidoreductase
MLKQTPYIAAGGRVLMALIFLISGFGKITAPTMTMGYINAVHLPFPMVAHIISIIIEIGGGILLIIGFQARIVAAVIAIFSVAAALSFHNNFADPNQMMNFLKKISMAGGLLQVLVFGAGSFSIDNRKAGSRPRVFAELRGQRLPLQISPMPFVPNTYKR